MKGMALRFLMAHPWAISGDQLEVMAGLSARDLDNINLSELSGFAPAPMAVATKVGQRNAAGTEMRDGIAIIPVSGVISRYASMFQAYCGGTSTQALATSIQAALDDPSCRGILLSVDSGGGEANGVHELAEMIYAARGKKPIKAYVGGTGASAAYWIAAAADEVIMDATAQVGSIGTVQGFRFRKDDASIETLELVSSQSPDKRLDPRTDAGKAKYQASLDQLSDVFISCVAKYRGVKRDKVLSDFGQGWCLIGADAVKAGMVDKLGSYESTINEMKKGTSSMTIKAEAGTIAQNISMSAGMSVADVVASLNEHAPEVVAAIAGEKVQAVCMTVEGVGAFIGAQAEDVQAAIKAHFAEAPAMALDNAAEVVASLTSAGVPEMAVQFLKPGATLASAQATAAMASSLRDTLAAAGMSGSLASLMAVSDNPGQMVAKAIQEAQAVSAAVDQVEAEAPTKPKASLDYKSIYEGRK